MLPMGRKLRESLLHPINNMNEHGCIVIAEAGVNHNGQIDLALKLIDAAVEAGADFVKFQTFKAEKIVTAAAKKADYQAANTGRKDDAGQLEMIKALEIGYDEHVQLIAHCKKRGIGFLSTPFDLGSIDLLVSLGIERIKIPSGEITNLPYLRRVGESELPLYLSTGMCGMSEIEFAINTLVGSGLEREKITVMHCNTEYPTPIEDVNLRAMQTIGAAFGVPIGYSDHTLGIEVSLAAVALGAKVIEKHFTLDRNMDGPDHRASIEPMELRELVKGVRIIERALGSEIKAPSVSERKNMEVVRKSIVASRRIEKGEVLTEQNLTAKRPGTGISPIHWDSVIGQQATRDYEEDEVLNW